MFGLSDDLYHVIERMQKAGDELAMVLSAGLTELDMSRERSEYLNGLLKAWEDSKDQKGVWE